MGLKGGNGGASVVSAGLHDSACHDLAQLFLEDEGGASDGDVARLAQAIQGAIENWFFAFEYDQTKKPAGGKRSPATD